MGGPTVLKLIPPYQGTKSPNYYIRGSYLGERVFQSTQTADRALAQRDLARIKKDIENGRFTDRKGPTVDDAIAAYLAAGGERTFMRPLLEHFRSVPLDNLDQARIDAAAEALYPNATAATRNRQVYTPLSAVLKRAGVNLALKRPKGHAGKKRLQWLKDENEAGRLFEEATKVDRELAILLVLVVYTGMRLGEALALLVRDLDLAASFVYLPHSKNEEPRAIHLPPFVVSAMGSHPRGLDREGRIFRFTKGQRLYQLLKRATVAAGVPWFTFHHGCHTYATWMRRHAGLDERGLVGTGRWKDQKSVARYAHVVTTEEAMKADLLPTPKARMAG
jgi:integrase